MNSKPSNYEKMKNLTAATFLENIQGKKIEKLNLKHNRAYIYINFVGRCYRVDRSSGKTEWSKDSFKTINEAGYNEVMSIYDVLCYSKDGCRLSGESVGLSSLSRIKSGNLAPKKNFFQGSADFFSGKIPQLINACKKMQGEQTSPGDVAYKLKLFDFLPVSVHFWETDDEFPPSLQIIVDKNILDFMHYETLMFALSHLFYRLEEEIKAQPLR